jgi:hypothetical protein
MHYLEDVGTGTQNEAMGRKLNSIYNQRNVTHESLGVKRGNFLYHSQGVIHLELKQG